MLAVGCGEEQRRVRAVRQRPRIHRGFGAVLRGVTRTRSRVGGVECQYAGVLFGGYLVDMILTERQQAFISEYIRLGNAAEAAVAAGYSKKTARQQASLMLTRPHVQAALQELKERAAARCAVTAASVLQRLAEHADADPLDLLDPVTGDLKPLDQIPLAARRRITALEIVALRDADGAITGHVRKVKLSDPLRAIELCGKHKLVDAFTKDVGVNLNLPVVVLRNYTGRALEEQDEKLLQGEHEEVAVEPGVPHGSLAAPRATSPRLASELDARPQPAPLAARWGADLEPESEPEPEPEPAAPRWTFEL